MYTVFFSLLKLNKNKEKEINLKVTPKKIVTISRGLTNYRKN